MGTTFTTIIAYIQMLTLRLNKIGIKKLNYFLFIILFNFFINYIFFLNINFKIGSAIGGTKQSSAAFRALMILDVAKTLKYANLHLP